MLEAPALAKIQKDYGSRKVQVVAVNVMRSAPLDRWRKYLERYGGGNLTFAQDPEYEAVRALNIQTAGATVIFDSRGKIVFRDRYATTFEVLREAVEKAL